jgi:hypothetical protein
MSKVGLAMSEAGRPGGRASEREEEIGAKTMNDHPSSSVELVVLSEEEPKPGGGSLVLVIENDRELAEEIRLGRLVRATWLPAGSSSVWPEALHIPRKSPSFSVAGRCAHLQPQRNAGRSCHQWRGGNPQNKSEARFRRPGGSGQWNQGRRSGDHQSADQPRRWQQGTGSRWLPLAKIDSHLATTTATRVR